MVATAAAIKFHRRHYCRRLASAAPFSLPSCYTACRLAVSSGGDQRACPWLPLIWRVAASGIWQWRHTKGSADIASATTLASAAPSDHRRIASAAVVPTERERAAFLHPVGGGGWFMPCSATHPTEPRRCWAINPTDSNGDLPDTSMAFFRSGPVFDRHGPEPGIGTEHSIQLIQTKLLSPFCMRMYSFHRYANNSIGYETVTIFALNYIV